ncbi:hypothetical protein D3C86_1933100 [compost metagenome]
MVMAAGSVINDPRSGTAASPSHAVAIGVGSGTARATMFTLAMTVRSTGREAATTITTKTKSGSV